MLIVRRGSIVPLIIGASALVVGTGLLMRTGQLPTDVAAVATAPVDASPEGDVGASCLAGLADPVLRDGPYIRHLAGWS
ncbi:MAG TPA: hypothetical protein VID94_05685, partial [Acidimicrobiales bacterium]